MTTLTPGNDDRMLELLAGGALGGLDTSESTELDRLILADPSVEEELTGLELTAAALAVSLAPAEPLPDTLRQSLLRSSAGASPEPKLTVDAPPVQTWWIAAGWLAAAACLVLALVGWLRPRTDTFSEVDPVIAMQSFIAETPDVIRASWSPWTEESEQPEVTGEVLWSGKRQCGFMVFDGLAEHGEAEQYQLWIVDDNRAKDDDRGMGQRVNGGIFSAKPGRTIVQFKPEVTADQAWLFAVTVERTGGVVVSDMARKVVVAAPKTD